MPKIPKFKDREEERRFWETHSFVDYVDDTEEVRVRRDSNATRRRTWSVHVYLEPDEALALEALSEKLGRPKNTILRQAFHRFLESEVGAKKKHPFLNGVRPNDIPIESLKTQFSSERPTRDADLAKRFKTVLMVAFPACKKVDVAVNQLKDSYSDEILDTLARDTEVQGTMSSKDKDRIKETVQKIANRVLRHKLLARHPITQAV